MKMNFGISEGPRVVYKVLFILKQSHFLKKTWKKSIKILEMTVKDAHLEIPKSTCTHKNSPLSGSVCERGNCVCICVF